MLLPARRRRQLFQCGFAAIPRNIELLRYRRYGPDLLLLELVRGGYAGPLQRRSRAPEDAEKKIEVSPDATVLQDVWESLKAFLLALGEDVQLKELELYIAFRRLKNFACVRLRSRDIQIWVRLDPASITFEEGFTRDVSQIGHAGTGDVEIRIQNKADLERAQPLLLRSYQAA